ncbi:MAG: NAD(P)H-hydrate dehydratase [Burkholderiales bacterium]
MRNIDDALLRAWPLPAPDADGDKDGRGRLLVIAGNRETPGAALLAATAAMRAGAGKVTVATGERIAVMLGLAVPEVRVIALPEGDDGALRRNAWRALDALTAPFDAVLAGPGLGDEEGVARVIDEALRRNDAATAILDAAALPLLARGRLPPSTRAAHVATPHAGEMARLTGLDKDAIEADREFVAREAAARLHAVVVLKGADTVIAAPDGRAWRHAGANPGLAMSGSGDVLAGLIAGLAARGTPAEQAAVWGVALHAAAGAAFARQLGPVGFLARELTAVVPALLAARAARSR